MRPEGAVVYVGCVCRLRLRPCDVRDAAFLSAGRRPLMGPQSSSELQVMVLISPAEDVEPKS
jgi:hypothetical protein